jgi:enamine deaminase RidA (YjgF/YER057c/UK114 family)
MGVIPTDVEYFPAVNALDARHFTPPYPAHMTVAVAALPLAALIEIKFIA